VSGSKDSREDGTEEDSKRERRNRLDVREEAGESSTSCYSKFRIAAIYFSKYTTLNKCMLLIYVVIARVGNCDSSRVREV
jgi:hypothetical protein